MSDTRIYVLAGAFLIGAAAPSAAADGDGKYNGALQRSIYDVASGEYVRGYEPILREGRAASEQPVHLNEWQRRQQSEEPFYMRNETQTAD